MRKQPVILHDERTIVYDEKHWETLGRKRQRAARVMRALEDRGIQSFVYGSVARGNVTEHSDVDIVIPQPIPSYKVELALERWSRREIVQATPSMVLKAHIYVDEETTVTFPLFKFRTREIEFYRWGGWINTDQLQNNMRVLGVDKRLVLITPTEQGHKESGVIGREHEVAHIIGVQPDIALERVRVLTRRSNIGRTGVYLTRPLNDDESFEQVAKSLKDRDPALRRTVNWREK